MKNKKPFKCTNYDEKLQEQPCDKQYVDCGVAELQVEYDQITSEVDVNKVNAYTCSCGKNTVVKHRDKGVTPMFIDCFFCGGRAISHMYKVPQDLEHHLVAFVPRDKAEWKLYRKYLREFYKDENVDFRMINDMILASKDHCKRGGALMLPADQLSIN